MFPYGDRAFLGSDLGDVMDVFSSCRPVQDYQREFKVLRQIASGAFGSVHCVQRRDTKVIQAAKYIKSEKEDLHREVRALLSLRKSSLILQFVAFYSSSTSIQSVLVTEFLAGGDLCERTSAKDYGLTEQKCRTIVRQICRGVQFIHANRWLHLDLKPFNIVFSKKRDDYDLRIIDFGLARELGECNNIKIRMCGTIEYMSPEVMNCLDASPASDCWGIGVITYQLVSGGISPFFAVNRFRTMSKVLDCDYSLEEAELRKASSNAKDFISMLLIKDPKRRLTADQCLEHSWLRDEKAYLGILETLETSWMRRCLARRRWYRLFNAVCVMTRVRHMTANSSHNSSCDSENQLMCDASSEDDGNACRSATDGRSVSYIRGIGEYYNVFEKLHLISNNGAFGTVYSVQKVNCIDGFEVYSSRHVRLNMESVHREAAILYQLRFEKSIVHLEGLYVGPSHCVLVTEYLGGGDLVERVSRLSQGGKASNKSPIRTNFVLNEMKCKNFIHQICLGLEYIHRNKILHFDIKPFSVMFVSVDDDSSLKIADFSNARRFEVGDDGHEVSMKIDRLCGTIEFLSPEMIECTQATTATDCWGIGIIAYMLITGGKSPFYGGNRFRTMAKILTCNYELENIPELRHISPEAKLFIKSLLVLDPKQRLSASGCLAHPWLTSGDGNIDTLYTLETSWMKQLLARRRWHRWFNAVRATQRIKKFSEARARGMAG